MKQKDKFILDLFNKYVENKESDRILVTDVVTNLELQEDILKYVLGSLQYLFISSKIPEFSKDFTTYVKEDLPNKGNLTKLLSIDFSSHAKNGKLKHTHFVFDDKEWYLTTDEHVFDYSYTVKYDAAYSWFLLTLTTFLAYFLDNKKTIISKHPKIASTVEIIDIAFITEINEITTVFHNLATAEYVLSKEYTDLEYYDYGWLYTYALGTLITIALPEYNFVNKDIILSMNLILKSLRKNPTVESLLQKYTDRKQFGLFPRGRYISDYVYEFEESFGIEYFNYCFDALELSI